MSGRSNIASVADRARTVAAGAPVAGVYFLGRAAAFVLGEEALLLVAEDGVQQRVPVHAGAILSSASDTCRVLTGGDDGKVIATGPDGASEIISVDALNRWIDHVALAPDGTVAWSAGKQAFIQRRDGAARRLDLPSTVGGLAFAPKGLRLAVAHYNGATLWFPNAKAEPDRLGWKGSHLAAAFSPDGRFLVTAMQEPVLHGWRLTDRQHMRMQGYAARVRSLDWTADGKWLATSGAGQLVLWPFQGKSGPMGKAPQLLAAAADEEGRVDVVACHPRHPIVAAGYADGLLLLVRIEDGAEILARNPAASAVTALAWNADGSLLAFGTEDGDCGMLRNLG
ncbi:MAG TPA: WD40 repeat domain-containing protein [Xanthobacteraceae bacterium]